MGPEGLDASNPDSCQLVAQGSPGNVTDLVVLCGLLRQDWQSAIPARVVHSDGNGTRRTGCEQSEGADGLEHTSKCSLCSPTSIIMSLCEGRELRRAGLLHNQGCKFVVGGPQGSPVVVAQ